jgi:hypothetical protein
MRKMRREESRSIISRFFCGTEKGSLHDERKPKRRRKHFQDTATMVMKRGQP